MRSFALAATALLLGCPSTTPQDDDDETPEHPDDVDNTWIRNLSGTITYVKDYDSGDLSGQQCTETFTVSGSPLTATIPVECEACDVVYQTFVTEAEGSDCPGGDDLADEGRTGFDLRQADGDAVMWWYFEGWFSSEWYELGTGTLAQDWDGDKLAFAFDFEDPGNDQWGGNTTWGDGCLPCTWKGNYSMALDLAFELPDDWYAQQQAE